MCYLVARQEPSGALAITWTNDDFINKALINPSGSETGIFRDNQVNTTAADALAPSVAKSSAEWYWLIAR